MFKKLEKGQITNRAQVKNSVQRGITSAVLEQYPALEPYIEDILPRKSAVVLAKCNPMHCNFIVVNKRILFIEKDKIYVTTLRLLHQYPFMMTKVGVDKGAIKFVLGGANVMCPGLTHPHGDVATDFVEGAHVAVFAEGKEHALAVGRALMSRDKIRAENKGHGLETVHYLGDGLWSIDELD